MRLLLVIVMLLVASVPSLATDRTWTGAASGTWGTGAATNNWNPPGVTQNADNLTFGNLTTNRYAVGVSGSVYAKSITFPASNTNGYTISGGSSISVDGNLTNLPTGVTNTITPILRRKTSPVTYYIDGYLLTRSSPATLSPINTNFTITGSGTWNSQGYIIGGYNIVLTNSVTVIGAISCDTLDIYSTKIDEVTVKSNLTVHAGGELRLIDASGDDVAYAIVEGAFTNEPGATTTFKLQHDAYEIGYVDASAGTDISLKGTLNLLLDEATAGEFVDSEVWAVIWAGVDVPVDFDFSAVTVDPASSGSFAGCTFKKTSRQLPIRSKYYFNEIGQYETVVTPISYAWMSTPNAKGYRLWVCYVNESLFYNNAVFVFVLRDDSGDMFSVMGE